MRIGRGTVLGHRIRKMIYTMTNVYSTQISTIFVSIEQRSYPSFYIYTKSCKSELMQGLVEQKPLIDGVGGKGEEVLACVVHTREVNKVLGSWGFCIWWGQYPFPGKRIDQPWSVLDPQVDGGRVVEAQGRDLLSGGSEGEVDSTPAWFERGKPWSGGHFFLSDLTP